MHATMYYVIQHSVVVLAAFPPRPHPQPAKQYPSSSVYARLFNTSPSVQEMHQAVWVHALTCFQAK